MADRQLGSYLLSTTSVSAPIFTEFCFKDFKTQKILKLVTVILKPVSHILLCYSPHKSAFKKYISNKVKENLSNHCEDWAKEVTSGMCMSS